MHLSRARVLAAVLAVTMVAACGGPAHKPSGKVPTSQASPVAPVSYTAEHIKGALLRAGDVASGVHGEPVTFTGFAKDTVPSCADTKIALPGNPATTAQQYGPSDTRSSAPGYAQQAAVFPDAAEATKAFAQITAKIAKCPGTQHVASKKLSAKQITLPYAATWKTTTDTVNGWRHLQGFEKRTYSPSSSIINVIYEVYDYAERGNVIIASLYLKRVKPSAAGDPAAKAATGLLTEQLTKIG